MAAELLAIAPEIHQRRWLHNGLLPWGEVVLLDGATGVGKSAFCANMAASLVGTPETPDRRKMLYISSADQCYLRDHHLAAQDSGPDNLYDAVFEPPFSFDPEKEQPSYVIPFLLFLTEQLKEHRPVLVIIDSLEELFRRSGPTTVTSWQLFWRDLRKLARQHGCTMIIPRRQGLHEARQYGAFTKTGTEMAHFILTMHWHPIHPDQRVISVARDLTAGIGEQFHLTFQQTGRLQIRLVPVYEHVRPAKKPQTWQPDPDHLHEQRQIADEIEKLMCNKPTKSTDLKEAMKEQGYSARAVQRTLGMMKVKCCNVKGIWMYLPTVEMYIREVSEQAIAAENQPRTQGAEVVAPSSLSSPHRAVA